MMEIPVKDLATKVVCPALTAKGVACSKKGAYDGLCLTHWKIKSAEVKPAEINSNEKQRCSHVTKKNVGCENNAYGQDNDGEVACIKHGGPAKPDIKVLSSATTGWLGPLISMIKLRDSHSDAVQWFEAFITMHDIKDKSCFLTFREEVLQHFAKLSIENATVLLDTLGKKNMDWFIASLRFYAAQSDSQQIKDVLLGVARKNKITVGDIFTPTQAVEPDH
jgi:hypothetical protein